MTHLDAAPAAVLGRAFRVPKYIRDDEELMDLFNEMVTLLRRESAGLPMTTLQTVLLERISTTYVIIKYREEHGWEGLGVNAEKEMKAQWTDWLKEWNRLIASGQDKLRDQMLHDVVEVMKNNLTVELIPDKPTLQNVRLVLMEKLSKLGV